MKMWEIREGYDPEYMGRRGGEYEDGFEDGCEHGYRKAMKEMRSMNMRETYDMNRGGSQGGRMSNRYGMNGFMPPYMSYREEDDYEDMGERRRRDSRGRYM